MTAPAFQITVNPSGRQFAASPDTTLLGAAITAGVGLPYGCKDGACGACKCKKLAGEVVHDDYSSNAMTAQEAEAGYVLTCRAHARSDVVLESRQVADVDSFPIKKMPVRVGALERLAPDVMRMQLQLPASSVFQYHAGQYLEFILRDGVRRAYSMATPPHVQSTQPGVELHIRHMPGGVFTDHVFGPLKVKDILRVEGPFGSFFLREPSTKPLVFLATGTGFAPLQALIEHLAHHDNTRPVTLYWGGRQLQDLYAHDALLARAAALPWLRYVPVLSQAGVDWCGRRGYVSQAAVEDFADLSSYEVYACGSPRMVRDAQAACVQQRGLPEAAFYADAFTTAADQ